MIELFVENPIILLFIVTAVGYWVGSIRVRGSKLGVAAVLFVGLGFGALSPELHVPDTLVFLGLTIFVYTIGLSSGPIFFDTFRRRGFQDIGFVFLMLTLSGAMTVGIHFLFGFDAATTAGLFSGVSTNTPALAGLLDVINQKAGDAAINKQLSEAAVVGYSLSYPMGVLGVMLAISVMVRVLKVDFKQEAADLRKEYPLDQQILSITVRITNQNLVQTPMRDLIKRYDWVVVFGRMQRDERTFLPNWDTVLQLDDLVTLVGEISEVEATAAELGVIAEMHLSHDSREYDVRQIFVSNPDIAGQQLATLNLSERYSAVVTRVRRGDIDMLARGDTVLELGDRVRFVARREDLNKLASYFGDSYENLSQINLLSFGLGMALGLLLGTIQFELPGGVSFQLGFAGGPLIVALILGALRRTGPIVWTLPYSANLTLRQIGLILLLSGVGINSGHNFMQTILQGGGGMIFLAGTIISIITASLTLLIGYKLLRIPFSFLMGMVANQPAILDYSLEKSGNKLPNIGFTLILPIALITKIVYVQFLFSFLN